MAAPTRGIVVFGDVLGSRSDPVGSSRWLRHLAAQLDTTYAVSRLARFGVTQGDEVQGLLELGADPFRAILGAAFDEATRPMRWAIVGGAIDPDSGTGSATERTGDAFLGARDALAGARAKRTGLAVVSGDPGQDEVLAHVAPVLARLLEELTARQREIGRAIVIDGLRQADVASRLGISRPTVSVAAGRARIREIAGLHAAILTVFRRGLDTTLERAR